VLHFGVSTVVLIFYLWWRWRNAEEVIGFSSALVLAISILGPIALLIGYWLYGSRHLTCVFAASDYFGRRSWLGTCATWPLDSLKEVAHRRVEYNGRIFDRYLFIAKDGRLLFRLGSEVWTEEDREHVWKLLHVRPPSHTPSTIPFEEYRKEFHLPWWSS
jgi:hypothetical protein